MRVLVAPDKFKGTLTAVEAAQIIGTVLAEHGHEVVLAPMADGGDGTLDAILAHGATLTHGAAPRIVRTVDAHLRDHETTVALVGDVAVIEMARVCGLHGVLDRPLDPWTASSRGLGLAARAAIELGVRRISVALGGSASIDGGIGLLQVLGFRIDDTHGREVTPDLRGLLHAHAVSAPASPPSVVWHGLVDVTAPLCGPRGAIAFAPQKGVPVERLDEVDAGLARWAGLLAGLHGVDPVDVPGAGAAGGVGAALIAALGATVERGADAVATMVGLDEALTACDAVITGEGRFDRTTEAGKAPWIVIERATARQVPVHVIAGAIDEQAPIGAVASATACPGGLDPGPSLAQATDAWCRSMTG